MSVGARFADYDEAEAARKATALRPQAVVAATSSKLGGDDDVSANKKFMAPTKVATERGGTDSVRPGDRGRGHDRGSGGGGRGLSSESGGRGPPVAPRVSGAGSAGGTSPSFFSAAAAIRVTAGAPSAGALAAGAATRTAAAALAVSAVRQWRTTQNHHLSRRATQNHHVSQSQTPSGRNSTPPR